MRSTTHLVRSIAIQIVLRCLSMASIGRKLDNLQVSCDGRLQGCSSVQLIRQDYLHAKKFRMNLVV